MVDETPSPGTPGNPVKLTDPLMMRALAHPARIAIWTHLGLRGPATATECAEVAGLSPSACSYHLRALAKYGFVEEAPDSAADGRQRPWRVRVLALSTSHDTDDPAADVAAQYLAEAFQTDALENRARYLARRREYPAEWRQSLGEDHDVAHVTPGELEEFRRKLRELGDQYRRLDPAERPPGALPVRILIDMSPWFGPEEAQPEEAP
jgi:predicted ArsR family transcriptional regulator